MSNISLKALIITGIFYFATLQATKSQNGSPYITNYEMGNLANYQVWSMSQDNSKTMIFANRKGLLTFDGIHWEQIGMNVFPSALYNHTETNRIFVGCNGDFGYLSKNEKGEYNYHSLKPDTLKIGLVGKITADYEFIYFLSEEFIAAVQIDQPEKSYIIKTEPYSYLSFAFAIGGKVYVVNQEDRLYNMSNLLLLPLNINRPANISQVSFVLKYSDTQVMMGIGNKLFLFDGKKFDEFVLKDQKYLDASVLAGGTSLNDTTFALSTLIGGAMVVSKRTGQTLFTLNYQTGLPDDEIFAIGKDADGGLWLSHSLGLSRVDASLPVRNFSTYTGISGNLLSVIYSNNTLYVGTNNGLYYLSENKSYETHEIEVKVNEKAPAVKEPVKTTEEIKPKDEPQTTTPEPDKKKKGSFFSRMFKKAEESIKTSEEQTQTTGEAGGDKEKTKRKDDIKETVQKKKIYSLQSVSHQYKKVENLNDKCKQLVRFHNSVLVAGNNGIYELTDYKVKTIIKDIYVNAVFISNYSKELVYVCTSEGLYILSYIGGSWKYEKPAALNGISVYTLTETDAKTFWVGGENSAYKLVQNKDGLMASVYKIGSGLPEKVFLTIKDTTLYFFQSDAVFYYNKDKDTILQDVALTENIDELTFLTDQTGNFFIYNHGKWDIFNKSDSVKTALMSFVNLFNGVSYIYIDKNSNYWLIDGENKLYRINARKGLEYKAGLSLYIKSITDPDGLRFTISGLETGHQHNALKFTISAPFYIKREAVEYQYYIKGLKDKWSNWSRNPVIDFPYIPPGKYTLHVRARNILGYESEEQTIEFIIKKPFWLQWWFITLEVMIAIVLIILIIRMRERQLRREKEILEQKVRERTRTIEEQKHEIEGQRDALAQQNEEILQQKEEIEAQRDEIEAQRDQIMKQNEEIKASIHYAKRIQTAVMPAKENLDKWLPEYFVLFKPRDIVSGDFYWMTEKNDKVVVAAVDCTGHGVPGAFMSMLGISFLNEIVARGETQANYILNELRNYVKRTLSQTGKDNEQKDGMDISLCVFDFKKKTMQYAGAYNPLYLVRKGVLYETKADKMPIGIHMVDEKSFTNNELNIEKGDTIYLFSDGFEDQFGGEEGRKFMSKAFKRLLEDIQDKNMPEQKEFLDKTIEQWRGTYPQVDDVLVIGVRI